MPNLYIMIGLPAAGKDVLSKQMIENHENIVMHSSDSIRAELYGDESIQGDPNKIFTLMVRRTIEDLECGKNVIYNATNVSRRNRKTIIAMARKIPNITIIAVVMATPIEICKERNAARERQVPEHVYTKMLARWDTPLYAEGFDLIRVEHSHDSLVYWNETLQKMKDFGDQKNPHHTLSLYDHCVACQKNVPLRLSHAALFHDCGKILTQSFDEKNIAHYYNHEKVSSYLALCAGLSCYESALIGLHMISYFDDKVKKMKNFLDKDFWKDIEILHEADRMAH